MFKRITSASFIAFLFSCSTPNELGAGDEKPKSMSELYPLMYEMLNQITSLQPYMVSEKKFADPKNKTEIKSKLEKLSSLSESVMRHKSIQSPTYRISGEALNNHVQNTLKVFSTSSNSYARSMLSATPFACMSCHSQLPKDAKALWSIDSTILEGTDFEKAEFLFATNNYSAALELYNKVIRNFSPKDSDQDELSQALSHKVTLLVRVSRDLLATEKSLAQDLKNPGLPGFSKSNIRQWISQASRLRQEKFFRGTPNLADALKKSYRLLDSNSKKLVSAENQDLVEYLYLSGLLYEFLQKEENNSLKVPELLLNLARLDQGLNNEFFFSLDQLYLKECIDKFPTHPTAKKCFYAYRSALEELFTGTRGTELPEDIVEDLERYKTKLGI